MIPLSRRQRLLVGALLLAGGVWAIDSLTRDGPTRVSGAHAGDAKTAEAPAVLRWQDFDEIIAVHERNQPASIAERLQGLPRDLFRPTSLMETVLTQAQRAAEPEAAPQPTEPAFAERHHLAGVMLGKSPVAVIDGALLPLQAELDGHRLIELGRDYAVFAHIESDRRVRLELPASGVGTSDKN